MGTYRSVDFYFHRGPFAKGSPPHQAPCDGVFFTTKKGFEVLLTTTDPEAHTQDFIDQLGEHPKTLTIERTDPKIETQRYTEKILEQKGKNLSEEGKKLMLEDLKSPCTEAVAVFYAFSKAISMAKRIFAVMDTAPTGHTLLLLDTAGSYHRDSITRVWQKWRSSASMTHFCVKKRYNI